MVSTELSSEGRPFYIPVSLSPASAPHPSPKCSQSLQGGLAGRRGIAAVPKIAPQAAGGPRGLARAAKKLTASILKQFGNFRPRSSPKMTPTSWSARPTTRFHGAGGDFYSLA